MATFTVVMSTAGRPSLAVTLQSIQQQQLLPGDEILVMGDGPQQLAPRLVAELGPPFRYIERPPTGDWGHSQVNYGMSLASGNFVLGQDDDDIFTPRAFETMRQWCDLDRHALHAFKFLSHAHGVLPRDNVWDGHCIVLPNRQPLPQFGPEHHGDQYFIQDALRRYSRPMQHSEVIGIGRPQWQCYGWKLTAEKAVELGIAGEWNWGFYYTPLGQPDPVIGWGIARCHDRIVEIFCSPGLPEDAVQHMLASAQTDYRWQGRDETWPPPFLQ